jgi:NAD(P)-dependent dehydrogenase (short-subunit alcohol dehydrogenase family)
MNTPFTSSTASTTGTETAAASNHDQPVVLVTGANQGIGLQISRELAAKGFTVLVGSRNFERGEEAAKTIAGDARAIQLDVTDQTSINAAAERIGREFGRLDVLINNAAISNTSARPGMSVADYMQTAKASNIDLTEMRAIWETNVFGVVALTQAVLPLLRQNPGARIVNVSSALGSLQMVTDPANPFRSMFSPGYPASKTALNAITLGFAIELEPEGIKVNAVTPGFTKTNLNGYEGTETVEEGAAEAVRVALQGPDGPTGQFTATLGPVPW